MGQWGSTDNANGSVNWAAKTLNKGKGKAAQAANNAALYNSTTANAFVNKQTVGQFGVSVSERRSSNGTSEARKVTSPGWNLSACWVWGACWSCYLRMPSLDDGDGQRRI